MSEVVQHNSIGPRNKPMLLRQLPLQELRPKPMTTASTEKNPREFSWLWTRPR